MNNRSNSNPTSIELSIVIAVYSETVSLVETIQRLYQHNRDYIYEIILSVSPNSSRECLELCQKLSLEDPLIYMHIQKTNPGLGWAFREGMALSRGTHIALMCADLETEPEAIDRMVLKIESDDVDFVIANRWMKNGGFINYDTIKLVLNWIFQHIFKLLFLTRIGDLTFGFKILKRNIVEQIIWTGTLHEISVETTLRPIKMGYSCNQVPTVWTGRTAGRSQNTFFKNFRYVKLAFQILFGY
jgi:glycosyltransferase involved in cell wall biosynthesis